MTANTGLQLSFHQYGLSRQEFFHINWNNDRSLTWVVLLTDAEENVARVNTDFVMASVPHGYKIYFAAATESDHDILKPILESNGDFYQEKYDVGSETPTISVKSSRRGWAQISHHSKRGMGEKWAYIFATTEDRKVIRCLFENYEVEYGSLFVFPFIISKEEPHNWISVLERFFGRPPSGEFTSSVLEQSHSVMATYWEHGMTLVSSKITREQVEDIAQGIARQHSLNLTTKRSS